MKTGKESTPQSFKAIIAATALIVLLLNIAMLLPVSPVRAESEEQTCTGCSQSAETLHYVTVNIVDGKIVLQIEPLLLPETGCGACAENQGCPSEGETGNIQYIVTQQDETHTVILLTFEVNGMTFEYTITQSVLWSYSKSTTIADVTANLALEEIASGDTSTQYYSLRYQVQNVGYDFTVATRLVPLNSETYSSSATMMRYAPAGKTEVESLELVEFKSPVTLSEHYAVLGEVAKEIGKVYEKSGDETSAQLAQSYYIMKEEAINLSKLVEKQLQGYDKEIIESIALLTDDFCSDCVGICNALVSIVGCSFWDIFLSYLLCAAFGPLAWICGAIITLVIAAVCYYGVPPYCWNICASAGIC